MKEYICKEDIRNKLYDEDAITMRGVNIINNYPAADVREVKRGKWEVVEIQPLFSGMGMGKHLVYGCSECEYRCWDVLDNFKDKYNFCPNCGSDNREETDG